MRLRGFMSVGFRILGMCRRGVWGWGGGLCALWSDVGALCGAWCALWSGVGAPLCAARVLRAMWTRIISLITRITCIIDIVGLRTASRMPTPLLPSIHIIINHP
ncbi:hypothetical protein EDB19DRAFT_1682369 [Suillus lakei]|nr:hypothetical protein EDB19DRAFT_1682369 [Suillus lakei]